MHSLWGGSLGMVVRELKEEFPASELPELHDALDKRDIARVNRLLAPYRQQLLTTEQLLALGHAGHQTQPTDEELRRSRRGSLVLIWDLQSRAVESYGQMARRLRPS